MENAANSDRTSANKKEGKLAGQWGERMLPLAGIIIFLVIWQIAVTVLDVPTYLLPKPTEIMETIIDKFSSLMRHTWVTGYEMILGYLLLVSNSNL